MGMTDPIGDMLTRIRNAVRLRREVVVMPGSKLKLAVAGALKREGFIEDYSSKLVKEGNPHAELTITLRYGPDGEHVIQFIDRVSKPGRRIYAPADSIPKVLSGMGCSILSTSRGVLSDRECKKENVGGEILCRIG